MKVVGCAIEARWVEDFERVIAVALHWHELSCSVEIKDQDEVFNKTLLLDSFTESHAGGKGKPGLLKTILGKIPIFARHLGLEPIHKGLLLLAEALTESEVFVESWIRRICFGLYGRRFFVSENGECGLCSESYRSGDIIAILLGCSIPSARTGKVAERHPSITRTFLSKHKHTTISSASIPPRMRFSSHLILLSFAVCISRGDLILPKSSALSYP